MRSAGAAEEGVLAGGHEAALDRAVLLCEAFAELDELEARIVGEADARAAARTARYTDAPDARGAGAAEGGTVGVLRNPNPHPHPNPNPNPKPSQAVQMTVRQSIELALGCAWLQIVAWKVRTGRTGLGLGLGLG